MQCLTATIEIAQMSNARSVVMRLFPSVKSANNNFYCALPVYDRQIDLGLILATEKLLQCQRNERKTIKPMIRIMPFILQTIKLAKM